MLGQFRAVEIQASQESEAARAIEPSHLCALEWSGWTDDDMGASRRHFRRVLSGRRIH